MKIGTIAVCSKGIEGRITGFKFQKDGRILWVGERLSDGGKWQSLNPKPRSKYKLRQ